MNNKPVEAARVLWQNWQNDTCIKGLPDHCRPATIDEGYATQRALAALSGEQAIGYKIAASSAAGQSHLKITHPVYGRLLGGKAFPSGSTVDWIDHPMSVAELEFAFLFGEVVPAQAQTRDWQEVMSLVSAMHIGIELPGSRFEDAAAAGIAQIVADNASARNYVLGAKVVNGWQDIDLADHSIRLMINGDEKTRGQGSDALGDPRFALAWLVNTLGQQGIDIEKDQLVTTGVCGMPVPVALGDEVVGDFGDFGKVSVVLGNRC